MKCSVFTWKHVIQYFPPSPLGNQFLSHVTSSNVTWVFAVARGNIKTLAGWFIPGNIITTMVLNINMIKYVKTIFYVITGHTDKQAPGSFIFSLRNRENRPPFKAPLKNQNDGNAIRAYPSYGPTFGRAHDLYISNNAASNTASHTFFGITYQFPSGVRKSFTILAGTKHFSPSEVEVFYLV